jgi:hypothetical protein
MARFIDVHSGMKGLTEEQLLAAHRGDLAREGDEGVHFIKAWADPVAGKVFCLSEGPNRAAVERVHRGAGHATDEIYEVTLSVE